MDDLILFLLLILDFFFVLLGGKSPCNKLVLANDGKSSQQQSQLARLRKGRKNGPLLKRRNGYVQKEIRADSYSSKGWLQRQMDAIVAMETDKELLCALVVIRTALFFVQNPPVQLLVRNGWISPFIRLLQCTEKPQIMLHAALFFVEITATNQTLAVVEAGVVVPLLECLTYNDRNLRYQVVLCLGNIAGDCAKLRDFLLKEGVLGPLLTSVRESYDHSFLSVCIQTMTNMIRFDLPPLAKIRPLIDMLAVLCTQEVRNEVTQHILSGLELVSHGDSKCIKSILQQLI